jgi:Protein of unknown function (DUF4238)
MVDRGQRHHYVPQFYLRGWAGVDGRLCEYSRPFDPVKPRMVHPKATAFVHGLHTLHGLPGDASEVIERLFLQKVDQQGAS